MRFKVDTALLIDNEYFLKGEKIEIQLEEDGSEYVGFLRDFSESQISVEIDGELKQYSEDEISGIYKLK